MVYRTTTWGERCTKTQPIGDGPQDLPTVHAEHKQNSPISATSDTATPPFRDTTVVPTVAGTQLLRLESSENAWPVVYLTA
jgi:hypothetical protein